MRVLELWDSLKDDELVHDCPLITDAHQYCNFKLRDEAQQPLSKEAFAAMFNQVDRLNTLRETVASAGAVGEDICKNLGFESGSVEDSSVGCMLGVMAGDVLGCSVEGCSRQTILEQFRHGEVRHFLVCRHMGDQGADAGPRYGMYTDDSNSTLAVASSLCRLKRLVVVDVAMTCAEFVVRKKPARFCPASALSQATRLLDGSLTAYTAGRALFPNGSFANGGAMRIAPVGVVFRNADARTLREACRACCLSTHNNAEAVDGAAVIAALVGHCMNLPKPCSTPMAPLNSLEIFDKCRAVCVTPAMLEVIESLSRSFHSLPAGLSTASITPQDLERLSALNCLNFQIKAIEAVPLVVWAILRWATYPEQCLINIVSLGGDADTTASMAGAIIGALHGCAWLPHRWYDNLEEARDVFVDCGKQLALLSLGVGDIIGLTDYWPQ